MDRKFTLSCCSTVDLPYSYMESRDIPVLFYTYVVDGVEYDDDMGRDPEALPRFYRFLEEGKLPQTSQVNVAAYMDFFEKLLQKGDLLHIAFTSGQSGSVHNAFLAAEELRQKYPDRKLIVIDSLCSSSGYGMLVDDAADLRDAGAFARTLGRTLLYDEAEGTENLAVTSVTERYANIFDWLKAHDVNAAVIIVIMLVVAFFNMASALLILVLERTRMIGLLKALGMRSGELRRIFLWRAGFVTLRGLAWGNAVGLGLCLVQKWTHLIKLSSEGYLLSEVPVSLGWGWWLALNAGFVAAIVALLVIPTAVVSGVKPEETIRYE